MLMMSELGDYLKKKRGERGFSQRQLATYTGVSNATISQIENGTILRPRLEVLRAIAEQLHVPEQDLLRLAGYMIADPRADYVVAHFPEDDESPNYHIRYRTELELLRESRFHKMPFEDFLDAVIQAGIGIMKERRATRH